MRRESLLSEDWFEKAARDMRRVEILLAADDIEGAGFHLQQAVEKYLKGYLLGKGWELRRTHDLEILLNEAMVQDSRFEEYLDDCIIIREFYVQERYPFIGSSAPPRGELESAIEAIRQMVPLILEDPEQ
ncbi:MAG: HEPN domain-containing protein [Anaerolineae bacterium]|nr:HEPN domain-containing protein [Anaerolineae bacterium]